jgi:hypothetical protein
MSLSGRKTESITLHDTESDLKRSNKCVLVRHGFDAQKRQAKILCTTS